MINPPKTWQVFAKKKCNTSKLHSRKNQDQDNQEVKITVGMPEEKILL